MPKAHTFVVPTDSGLRYTFVVVEKGKDPIFLCKQSGEYWRVDLNREHGAKWVIRDLIYIKKMSVEY
jgi:hypothetical protein